MSEDKKIEVYVSYSRHEEERNSTVLLVQDKLETIDFKIDTNEIKYRDDFVEFINKIGCADRVMVLFSEAYMQSFYCMSELQKIIQHGGDLRSRVFPIRDPHYAINEKENQIKKYWKKALDDRDKGRNPEDKQSGTAEEIKELCGSLDDILKQIKTKHAPTAGDLVAAQFVPILDWLDQENKENNVDDRIRQNDDEYLIVARSHILELLNKSLLKSTLQRSLNCEHEDETALLNKLCLKDSKDLKNLLDNELKYTVNSLKSDTNYDDHRESMRKLASLLSIFVINQAWVKKIKLTSGMVIEIPVKSEFSGSAASARVYQTYPCYSAKSTDDQVKCAGKVPAMGKQGSWSNSNGHIVRRLVAHIWNHVFTDSPRQLKAKDTDFGRQEITNEQIEVFNDHLLRTKEHFYLEIPLSDGYEYFKDSQLIAQLSKKFPALIIFKLSSDDNEQLVLSNDLRLSMAYQRFLANL